MRVTEAAEPAYDRSHHYHEQSPFNARWVADPHAPVSAVFDEVFVARYRLPLQLAEPLRARIHVSADERYVLSLNGQPLGRGPERGDLNQWHFETYDLDLPAGAHELVAVVQSFGNHRPYAQVSIRHAFLVLAEGEQAGLLSTGVAPWTAERVDAYTAVAVTLPKAFVATGARVRIDAAGLHALREPLPVKAVGPVTLSSMRMESPGRWQLAPAVLPPMLEEAVVAQTVRAVSGPVGAPAWSAWLAGGPPITLPAHATAMVLVDLGGYFCAYSRLSVESGRGAAVTLHWAEALFEADGFTKALRDQTDGLHFAGIGDEFLCDGVATTFEPLWWSAGRYVRLSVTTGAEPLTLVQWSLTETRYPTRWDTTLDTDDPAINGWLPLTRRAMEMCSHETYFDCPYYEQLMYVGDTRLEALVTYAYSRDDRLPRKAARLFDQSRTPDGFTQARYPTKTAQVIPPFSFWWVGMVHDLAMWRDQPEAVARLMPGVRAVMEAGYAAVTADGLYQPTTGWNFVDWVPGWAGGVPPGGAERPVAPIHFTLAYAAMLAADLEDIAGEPQLAERHRQRNQRLTAAGHAAFFTAGRGLFADDESHTTFSEHAQCLALLAGAVKGDAPRAALAEALIGSADLARTTIYFTHYLFETYRQLGRIDGLFDRLQFWSGLVEGGFKTTPEQPEPSRSDCHAWGAHPMFHLVASVLGVRPASAGFKTVRIEPQLGPLRRLAAKIVHPRGTIDIEARRIGDHTEATVRLPADVTGTLVLNEEARSIG